MQRALSMLGIVVGLSALAPAAGATSDRMPTAFARRPLTLTDATLRLDDGPYWPLPSGLVETYFFDTGDGYDTWTRANFGLAFGISEDFELGFHLLNVDIEPDDGLNDPSVYVMYRFTEPVVEIGIYAEVTAPFEWDPVVTAGLPIAIHLGDVARIDTGPFIVHDFERDRGGFVHPVLRGEDDEPDLIVPFELPISVTRQVYLGPEAFFHYVDFDEGGVGLGFFAGYTFTSGGGTLGDIGGRLRVPDTDVGFDAFAVMLELDFFFDL